MVLPHSLYVYKAGGEVTGEKAPATKPAPLTYALIRLKVCVKM